MFHGSRRRLLIRIPDKKRLMSRTSKTSCHRAPIVTMHARRRELSRLQRRRVALFIVKTIALHAAAVAAFVSGEAFVGHDWRPLVVSALKSALGGSLLGSVVVGGLTLVVVEYEVKRMANDQTFCRPAPFERHFWFTTKSVGEAFQLAAAGGAFLRATSHATTATAKNVAVVVFAVLAVAVFWSVARIAARLKASALRWRDGIATRPA